jgi:dienelactone hydrolase
VLKKAFADAKLPAEVEVYQGLHGWCVPDMPAEAEAHYNKPDAERAWAKLLALQAARIVPTRASQSSTVKRSKLDGLPDGREVA